MNQDEKIILNMNFPCDQGTKKEKKKEQKMRKKGQTILFFFQDNFINKFT